MVIVLRRMFDTSMLWAIFSMRVECRTVSKALLKSKEMAVTDGLMRNMLVMVLSRETIAAHGEPVGRKTNWSESNKS